MATVTVDLPTEQYDILIDRGLRADFGHHIRQVWPTKKRLVIVTDSNVGPLYLADTQARCEAVGFEVVPLTVPAGEESKSLETLAELATQMIAHDIDRHDGVVTLGGGVMGDLGGMLAAIYMRGIPFIQIATSLTAQVDASVGGKTAVNFGNTKNILGVFHQPDLVLIDPNDLATLSDRDLAEGYGEVIKTSALAGPEFFAQTGQVMSCANIRDQALSLIEQAITYKANIVCQDEKEAGCRQWLNFGHTLGHAVELLAHGNLRHGEAIGIGMVAIAKRLAQQGLAPMELADQLITRLTAVGLPIDDPNIGSDAFYACLRHDKKTRGDHVTMVSLDAIGKPTRITIAKSDLSSFMAGEKICYVKD